MKLSTDIKCPCGNQEEINITFDVNEYQLNMRANCKRCKHDFLFEAERKLRFKREKDKDNITWIVSISNIRYRTYPTEVGKPTIKIYDRENK